MGGAQFTLRITIFEDPATVTLKLEGKAIGPWVSECRRAWMDLKSSLRERKFCIDLTGLFFIDDAGMELLREVYAETSATMVADSPLTRHFAELAVRRPDESGKEGD